MAEPILKLTRGIPKTDREWMDVFSKLTKHLRVEGDRLIIAPEIELPPSAALSVLGRAAASPGAPADIVAGSDGTFLKRAGSVLAFATITDGDIPATVARDSEVTSAVTTAISNHEAAPDPHPGYTTAAELTTAINGAITTHEGAADPHTGYAREAATTTISGAWTFSLPPVLPTYTVATLPAAATYARGLIYVSDETGGAVPAFSDGTNWRRVTDRAVVS